MLDHRITLVLFYVVIVLSTIAISVFMNSIFYFIILFCASSGLLVATLKKK